MNDGATRCPHGRPAALKPSEGYPEGYRTPAADCKPCAGKPCGIPRIDHGRPTRREPSDDKEDSPPGLHHLALLACLERRARP